MVRTEAPLIERMTLVWHDRFATSKAGVPQGLMLRQNALLRRHALGNFERLAHRTRPRRRRPARDRGRHARARRHRPLAPLVLLRSAGLAPVGDPAYRRLRPTLAISDGRAFAEDSRLAWHPSASALADLHGEGKVSVLPAAAYTNADQSHFTSRHFLEVGALDPHLRTGWLGRVLDRIGLPDNWLQGVSLDGQLSPTPRDREAGDRQVSGRAVRRLAGVLGAALCALAPPAQATAPSRVLVEATGFRFTLSRTTVSAGPAIVQLAIRGEDRHDLRLAPPRGRASARPAAVPETLPGGVSEWRGDSRGGAGRSTARSRATSGPGCGRR
jgi:hypothetical protein